MNSEKISEKALPAPATQPAEKTGRAAAAVKKVKKWGAFRITVVLAIIGSIVFLTILFAACHILPTFVSEHCTDNGTTNAAAVGKRAVELGARAFDLVHREASKIGTVILKKRANLGIDFIPDR